MDAATLLDHFTHDLANIPEEVKEMLNLLQKKDVEYDDTLKKIRNNDSQLFKYIKQHGSLVRHPKEDSLNEEILKLLDIARDIQNEKILLVNTALLNIAKHTVKFDRDIRRGIESGAIDHWDLSDSDIEMTDYLNNINGPIDLSSPSSFDSATPPVLSGISGGDVNHLTKKLNNSSLDNKMLQRPQKKNREKTPNTSSPAIDESLVSSRDSSTPSRRRDVAAGTIIKGSMNRRLNSAGIGGLNESSGMGEDDELYCFCQQVSYGAMVACDNPGCKYEWFHYDCVGLKEPPVGVWYCPECRKDGKNIKREKKKK